MNTINDPPPVASSDIVRFCRAVVTFLDFGPDETEVQCFQWHGKRAMIPTASIPAHIHRWPGSLAVCQASIEADTLECKEWEEGSQQTPEELEKWWMSLTEPNDKDVQPRERK